MCHGHGTRSGIWFAGCMTLGLLLFLVTSAGAAIPKKIAYQGKLTDAAGSPLPGDHTVFFTLHNAESGGIMLWSETQAVNADSNGVFSAILGSNTPIQISFADPKWLGITIDGYPLSPRREIVSVASAFNAQNADSLGSLPPGSYTLVGHTHYSLNAADGDPVNALYVNTEGRVGIGTTTPDKALTVVNPSSVSGAGAISGMATSPAAIESYGVKGETYSTSSDLAGAGVIGVASASTGGANGVVGETDAEIGSGVFGWALHTSGRNYGVWGQTSSPAGYAGYFWGGRNYFQGRVGIGTDEPLRLLHVYAGSSGATAHSSSAAVIESNVSATLSFLTPNMESQGLRFCDPEEQNAGWLMYDNDGDKMRLGAGNVEQLCITSNHKIGMGTLDPAVNLDIKQNTNGFVGIRVENTDTGSDSREGIYFRDEDGDGAFLSVYDNLSGRGAAMVLANNRPGGKLRFATDGTDRVSVTNTGRVGIGVDSPVEQLEVNGTIKAAAADTPLKLVTTSGGYIYLDTPSTQPIGLRLQRPTRTWYFVNGMGGDDNMGFYDASGPVGYERALVIDGPSHMVGVGTGTDTPTSRLDVSNGTGYNQFRMRTSYTPTSTTDTHGNVGDMAWDDNYIYVKTSAGWKRAALSLWGL